MNRILHGPILLFVLIRMEKADPPKVVLDLLGQQSLATTSVYVTTQRDNRGRGPRGKGRCRRKSLAWGMLKIGYNET